MFVPTSGTLDTTAAFTQFAGTVQAPSTSGVRPGEPGRHRRGHVSEVRTEVDDVVLADLTSGGTQMFTVTRSVNGVVKSHQPGEDIRLALSPPCWR